MYKKLLTLFLLFMFIIIFINDAQYNLSDMYQEFKEEGLFSIFRLKLLIFKQEEHVIYIFNPKKG
jgi:hypothetical protein